MAALKSYWHAFLELLYPNLCYGCQVALVQQEEFLCSSCLFHLPLTQFHIDRNNPCFQQLKGRCAVEFATAMFYLAPSGIVEQMLYQLKYNNKPQLGQFLGATYGETLKSCDFLTDVTCIVPIPLHPRKQRKRGYNQAEQFGQGLSKSLNIPLRNDLLFRLKNTKSQTKMSRMDRLENVESVFRCSTASNINDQHLLLVDDVLTTGATLIAAIQIISQGYPNCRISVACIAKA